METSGLDRSREAQQSERYRALSKRYLDDALAEVQAFRWQRAEELLWGGMTAAVMAVAWSRGTLLKGNSQVEAYASSLATETRDRRIRDAFRRLSSFSTLFDRVHDSRVNTRGAFLVVDEVGSAVERLWRLIPAEDEA